MLLGVEISYVYQNFDQISWEIRDTNYSHTVKNAMALKILVFTGQKFYHGDQAPSASEISETFNCPQPLMQDMLSLLVDQGLLNIIDREPLGYAPAKSLEKITVNEVFTKVQTSGINIIQEKEPQILSRKVLKIMEKYNKTLNKSFGKTSIYDLIENEN